MVQRVLALLMLGQTVRAATPSQPPRPLTRDEALRRELLARVKIDQEVRPELDE